MKKGLIFLLLFNIIFAYKLVVKSDKDYELLKTLGVECKKTQNTYVCVESNDKQKLENLKKYLQNNVGIKTYIVSDTTNPTNNLIKTGYCIQVLSSKKASGLDDFFEKLKNLPYSRIEKIGNYFVLRIGESPKTHQLKSILKEVKKIKKDAFIRKCDLIPKRIIKSNFELQNHQSSTTNTLEKIKRILYSNSTPKEVVIKKKKTTQIQKTSKEEVFEKKTFKQTIESLYEKGDYKRVCDLLTKLNKFYNDNLDNYKKNACFNYYYNKGMELIYVKPNSAIELFDKAIQYKTNKDILFAKAIALMNKHKDEEALKILRNLYSQNPDDEAIKLAYAKALFNVGNFIELESIKDNSLSFFKHYEMFKKAKKYYKDGEYVVAAKILEKLREYYPTNTRILLLSGNIEYKLGNYDLAYVYYKKVLEIENKNIVALKAMRNLAVENRDIHSAVEISEMLKNLNYSDAKLDEVMKEYYLLQADKLRKEKKYEEALKMVEKARKFTKYSSDIDLMNAKIYYDMGKYDKALESYRLLSANGMASADIKAELVKLYVKKGDFESAKDLIQDAPKDVKAIYYAALAKYYFDKKEYLNANKNISIALSLNPIDTKEIYKLKAQICFVLDNLECSKRFYEKIKLENPEDKLNYALVLAKLGKKNLAYKVAQSIKSENKNVLLKKASLMIQLGKTKEAKEIFEMVD